MCGIVAAIGLDGAADQVVRALRHRGPDQAGLVRDGNVALGAARLRINGDHRADQPLAEGNLLLVANGEVFNHEELRALGPAGAGSSGAAPADGRDDAGEGDLPPLARALDASFPAAVARIRGPFALAAFHRQAGTLLLARDEAGVRPLHVLERQGVVVAASEVWPLLELMRGAPDLDREALAHLLAFQFLPPGRTLFRSITSVRPGEARIYDRSGGEVARGSFRYEGRGDAETDLGQALRQAAALQGARSVRAAIFLSGGMDSSAVAGLLASAGHPPELAITGWFPDGDPSQDERPHARAVAAELGLELLEVPIHASDALEGLPALVRALGGPLAGPGGMAQLHLARAAAEAGVRIVYSGEGGDELFGGYERHRLLQQIEAGAAPDPLPAYLPLARRMAGSDDPLAAAIFRGAELLPLLRPEMAADVVRAALEALPPPGPGRADRALAFERERFLPGLLAVDDATLCAFGIEGRVPLLDPVVAALAAAVPLAEKSPPGATRRLLRAALGDALPLAAARRKDKMGFPMPLAAWLAAPPWRELALDRLKPASLDRFGFDGGKVRAAFEASQLSPRAAWFLLALDTLDELLASRAS